MDGAAFRRMMISAAASIEIHKQQINELNVFPVPDGDTGTNMSLTINTACGDLRKLEDPTLTKARPPMLPLRRCCVAPAATPASSFPCCSGALPKLSRARRKATAPISPPPSMPVWRPPTKPS